MYVKMDFDDTFNVYTLAYRAVSSTQTSSTSTSTSTSTLVSLQVLVTSATISSVY